MDKKDINSSRRGFLSKSIKILPSVAIASAGFSSIAQAQMPDIPGTIDSTKNKTPYTPKFFNDEEWRFILSATDILIPEDELGAGAIATNVPEFIDRQMDTPYAYGQLWYMKGPFHPEIMKSTPTLGYQLNMTPRNIYQSGIKAFNDWCKKEFGEVFSELTLDNKNKAMQLLSDNKIEFPDDAVFAITFFEQLWGNTKEGFFSDPMYAGNNNMEGWKTIGFPGARADYLDFADRHNEEYKLGPVSIEGNQG